ncbi:MAG: PilZ domain-containing protein [Rhodospirillales bacterium]
MNKKFSGSERRRHPREDASSICLKFEDRVFSTVNWSLGGFTTDGYEGELSPGSLFNVEAVGSGGKDMKPILIRARVQRFDPSTGHLAVTFLDIDDRAYPILRELMTKHMESLKE